MNCAALTSVTISEGVTKIAEEAFIGCTKLETITLPAGIKSISKSAFAGCTGVTTINVPAKKGDYYKKRLPEQFHQCIVEMEPVKKAKKK